ASWRERAMRPDHRGSLVEVVPPRVLEDGLAAARSMVAILAGEIVALEVAVSSAGPRWYLRTPDGASVDRVVASIGALYPEVGVERIPAPRPARDLAHRSAVGHRRTWSVAQADTALHLRTEWRGGADPLAGILAAAPVRHGERVLIRCSFGPAPDRAAD